MEIERKWLVDKSRIKAFTNFGYRIEQHYLNDLEDEWLIRVRNNMGTYTMTIKGKGLLTRPEIETPIREDVYLQAIKHSKKSVKKTRFYVSTYNEPITERTMGCYEIDVFDDYDFIICELEFFSIEEADLFNPPSWCLDEITNDPKYTNYNLAK